MSALEVNKIIASILVALIILFLISVIGNFLVNPNEDVYAAAYKIEVLDEENNTAKSSNSNEIEPISSLLVNASIENGQKIYKKCLGCHNYEKDSANKVGPNLWNVINRSKASVSEFAYSKALAEYGGIWGYEELNQFLYKPKEYMPGTKMNFSGLKKNEDRADLIYFLRDQSENPLPLP